MPRSDHDHENRKNGIYFSIMSCKRRTAGNKLGTISFSRPSDYHSGEVEVEKKRTGYRIEILLHPDNKRLIINLEELLKIVGTCLVLLMGRWAVTVLTPVERVFQRRRWLKRNYFELASLLNIILGTLQGSNNSSGKLDKLILTRETVDRVLSKYRKRLYDSYRAIDKAGGNAEQLKETLRRTAEIVHRELVRVHAPYERNERIRKLFTGILRECRFIF
jgi:hypothetical protein